MIAWVALICRFTVGFLFLAAGLSKLPERDRFAHAIENYRLLPESLPRVIALWLPPLEIAAGVALLAGLATRLAALLLASMLGVFILGVGLNLLRGRRIDCGCMGGKYKEITWAHVMKNAVLAGAALLVAALGPVTLALDNAVAPGSAAANGTGFAALVTVSLALAVVALWGAHRSLERAQSFLRV